VPNKEKQVPLGDYKINLDKEHHRKLKILAAQEDLTMRAILEQMIDERVSSSKGTENE